MADVVADAKELHTRRMAEQPQKKRSSKKSKTKPKATSVLEMEDLAASLEQNGINVVKPRYFADEPL